MKEKHSGFGDRVYSRTSSLSISQCKGGTVRKSDASLGKPESHLSCMGMNRGAYKSVSPSTDWDNDSA